MFNETIIKERSSTFIAQSFPVENETEANEILEKTKKHYYDASHHCYAVNLYGGKIKYSDAGEPSGTAGIRILNAINHFSLFNVLVIVIRYFGGTKLGAGLLGKTYYSAALNVLESSSIIEKLGYKKILIEADPDQINNIYHLSELFNGKITGSEFANDFKMECLILSEETEKFAANLNDISKGNARIKIDQNIIFL